MKNIDELQEEIDELLVEIDRTRKELEALRKFNVYKLYSSNRLYKYFY